jgi:Lon protease-like protein
MEEREQRQMAPRDDLSELALFPLNLVLFPGMRLPLHIFEERYKAMIGACIAGEEPFGVLLIKEGQESGEPAEPVQVGTTARITQVNRLEDGRMNILTEGERRFELVEIIQTRPHMVGLVRYLEEESGEVLESILVEIREEYATFLKQLATVAGGWNSRVDLPEEPSQLSAEVIASLSSSIEMTTEVRQRLLETPALQSRLELVLQLLKQGNELMQEKAEQSNPFRGYRLN